MARRSKLSVAVGFAVAAAMTIGAGAARADGMPKKRATAAPKVEEAKRDWTLTANFGATSDYIFRGFSQTAGNWAAQGGVDFGYKWFYAGFWASSLDFGRDVDASGSIGPVARAEIDFYAGLKPVAGPVTFDIGVIYYAYPRAIDGPLFVNRELDYVELKVGASGEIWKGGTAGMTVFYSPEYTNEQGRVWTIEGTIAHVLPTVHGITPTLSALLAYQKGDNARYRLLTGNGDDSYLYWNAGIGLGFGDRFTLDLRYWDTDISNAGGFCTGALFQCDSRFVATAKVTY